ncbi:MAG: 5'-methylthioadenosine/adenosylhomocysteine nucleosidase [Ruminococcaceae bacterium]|nr:5'-methylthioadenosine/adenosylhomocysteine nucleosidase [Oscillospiraceae bacterium]
MLGIIGAMDVEVNSLKSIVTNKTSKYFADIEFIIGEIESSKVCIAQCSPGKVNAALCTQLMIDKFDIDNIINIGVGCSLDESVVIKDIVVASDLCQYDYDITALGEEWGLINGIDKVKIETSCELSKKLEETAKSCGYNVHRGTIASGDTFIGSKEQKKRINNHFSAVCGEMEGGAIAQVCYINRVPFAVLRTISDGGDENVQINYPEFKAIAAKISSEILLSYLRQ